MSPLRVFWDVVDGWTVETPIALTPRQVDAVVAWTKKVQGPRVAAMHGDKREQAAGALLSLTRTTLKQRVVVKPSQERVLYTLD
jgi:hypothetical protein